MRKILVVVDMQNDFINGSLGTPEARAIVPNVAEFIKNFDGFIYATEDLHDEDYLNTLEGEKLPVLHCLEGTKGAYINKIIMNAMSDFASHMIIQKSTFASDCLAQCSGVDAADVIYICGVCTDICVISNALYLRAVYPNKKIVVLKDLCAGTTPELHQKALDVMQSCQIDIE